jgi:hypothetical protein
MCGPYVDFNFQNIVVREDGNKRAYEEAVRKNPGRFWIGPNDVPDVYQVYFC